MKMDFVYQKLLDTYEGDTAIILKDVDLGGMSSNSKRQMFMRLEKSGKLKRYSRGVYYIPSDTPYGDSILNFREVLEKKYIKKDGKTIGYYSGIQIENLLGLTTQVSNVPYVVSNAETTTGRYINLRKRKVYIRRPDTEVNEGNWKILQFADLLASLSGTKLSEGNRRSLINYAESTGVTIEKILSVGIKNEKKMNALLMTILRNGLNNEL